MPPRRETSGRGRGEMVDAIDLESISLAENAGSSPADRTTLEPLQE